VVTLPSETHLFSHGLRLLDAQVQSGLLTSPATGTVYLPRAEWVAAMRAFCVLTYGRVADSLNPRAALVVERSPHHVEHLSLIGEVFPDARVVHIIRDGRDVARSLARQTWGPGGVSEAARQWSDSVRAARADAPALKHYHEVRYESVLSDPEGESTRLFEQLGLPADAAVLDAVKAASDVLFNVDVNAPQVAVGKWRAEWQPRQLAAFNTVAGDMLDELGYPDLPLAKRPTRIAVRRALGRARSMVRTRRGRGVSPVDHNPVITPLEALQITVDRFLAAAAAGSELPDLAGTATVRYAGPDGTWTAYGADGARRLTAAFGREKAWGPQLRGDEQMHGRTVIVTLTNAGEDDAYVDRVVVLGFANDGTIDHIGYSRFPMRELTP
jgi:hypothetical protein